MTPVHFIFGGIHNTGVNVQIVIVVIAGLLLGKRATLFFTALAVVLVTIMVAAEMLGLLPEPIVTISPVLQGLNFVVPLLVIATLLFVAVSGLNNALEQRRSNEQILAQRNKELAETKKSLEKNVARLENTQSLMNEYATELERSNRELQDFAYVVSHDLQAPLRKVDVFGDRLLTNYSGLLDERGQDYIRRMQNASSRMRSLIEDLLLFSRVTTQAKPFTAVNLNNVIAAVLADLETKIDESNGRVICEELPTIEADPTQMNQLFQNLIENALKFQRQGVPPVIMIASQTTQNEAILITISDNGVGFEQHYEDRIFKVFERLHTQDEYEGTGIGLAICRRIIERHHGRVTVKSQPDEGTQFTIVLPLKQPKERSLLED
jgi:light-regulated signal transduction histidine kinase (bacteriophytochrome)